MSRERDGAVADVVRGSRQGTARRIPCSVLPGRTGPPHPHAPALREHGLERGHESPRRAPEAGAFGPPFRGERDRKSTRLNSSHLVISYAVFCLKKKKN